MSTRKLEVRRLYDKTAQIYDRRYGNIQKGKYEFALEHVHRARRVLDLGCGTGMLLGELAGRSETLVGVDSSQGMLKIARGRGKFLLVCADADNLPFPSNCFDAVVSITLLQNMPVPSRTVKEMARVLRPRGKVILTALKRKCDRSDLEEWVKSAGLAQIESGEVEGSEDVFCVATRG